MYTQKRLIEALNALEPQKVYTYAELLNATSTGAGSYIVPDLIAIGRIERVLNGYKLKQ